MRKQYSILYGLLLVAVFLCACVQQQAPAPFTQSLEITSTSTNVTIDEISMSPDGRHFATTSEFGVVLYAVDTFAEMWFIQTEHPAYSVAFSPNSTEIASGLDDGSVVILEVATGKMVQLFNVAAEQIIALAWSDDGNFLAVGSSDSVVAILDAESGEAIRHLRVYSEPISGLDWLPGTKNLGVSTYAGRLLIWDTEEDDKKEIKIASNWIGDLAWNPEGTLLGIASMGGKVLVWDMNTAAVSHKLDRQAGWIFSIAWSKDGTKIAFGTDSGEIILWDFLTDEQLVIRKQIGEHPANRVQGLEWVSNDTLISASGNEIILWNVERKEQMKILLVEK